MDFAVEDWHRKIHDQTGSDLMQLSPVAHHKANNTIHDFLTQLFGLVQKAHTKSLSEDEVRRTYNKSKHEFEKAVFNLPMLSLNQRSILKTIVYQAIYDDVNSSLPFRLIGDEGVGDVQAYIL